MRKTLWYIMGLLVLVFSIGIFYVYPYSSINKSTSQKIIQEDSLQNISKKYDKEKTRSTVSSEQANKLPGKKTRVEASQVNSEELNKSNPPITQETIDRLNRELNQKQSSNGNKRILSVIPQIQRAWNTCSLTTVSMMLSSRGISVSQEQLAKEMGTNNTFGTHNANAIRVLNRYLFGYETPQPHQAGYRLETVTTSNPNSEQMRLFKERLKQNIADGYPMYYTFDCTKMYPGSYGEHNVIGTGYQLTSDGSDIEYIYYIDPSYNQQDPIYGGLKKITPKELFEAMLTCVEPNYAW